MINKSVLGFGGALILGVLATAPVVSADSGLLSSDDAGLSIQSVNTEFENTAIRGVLSSSVAPGPGVTAPDGIMRFVISDSVGCDLPAQSILVDGVASDSTIESPSGVVTPLIEGFNAIAEAGIWTINGDFEKFGGYSGHVVNCLTEVSEWSNTGTTDLTAAFYDAANLTHVEEVPLTTVNITNMFEDAVSFNQDISDWELPALTSANFAFLGAATFNNGGQAFDLDTPVLRQAGGFFSLSSSFDQDITDWNVPELTNTALMFQGSTSFNNGGQPFDWDTPSLTQVREMFQGTGVFNQDISGWNVPSLANAQSLFLSAVSFNNGGEPWAWETPSLIRADSMFRFATAMDRDLSEWDVCTITSYATFADGTDAGHWPVSSHPVFGLGC